MISLKSLSFSYGKKEILEQIDLKIDKGDFLGILGPNGSGKSTLLKLINGILNPTYGSVTIKGRDVREYSTRQRARLLSYIPQNVPVYFPFSVYETVMAGRFPYIGYLGQGSEKDKEVVLRAMELVEISDIAHRKLTELSGGERQRVAIATCLAQDSEILLLDEPVSNLDIYYQKQILNLLKSLNQEHGKTIVMAVHDINMAYGFCNKSLFLKQGRIAFNGPTKEIMREDVIETVYDTTVVVFEDRGNKVFVPDYTLAQGDEGISRLIEKDRELTENYLIGGFVHELRNALQGPKMILESNKLPNITKDVEQDIEHLVHLAMDKGFSRDEMKLLLDMFRNYLDVLEFKRKLDLCLSGINRALSLTDTVVDYVHLKDIKSDDIIYFKGLLEELCLSLSPSIEKNGIRLMVDVREGTRLFMGKQHLYSILENLILNSIEAFEGGGSIIQKEKYIWIRSSIKKETLYIEIEDNGPGIKDEDMVKVFRPFFTTKPYRGRGLGLSIVHRLVMGYGGRIYVQSEIGKGTKFCIAFPKGAYDV